MGTIIAGSGAPGIEQLLAAVNQWGTKKESTVLVHGRKLPAPSAALINASMAHSRELDINDDRLAYKTSVETTARDAADRKYNCFLVDDACATKNQELHDGTMRNFELLFGKVVTTEEIIKELAALLENKGITRANKEI